MLMAVKIRLIPVSSRRITTGEMAMQIKKTKGKTAQKQMKA